MDRFVGVQCPILEGDDPCPYCDSDDCAGHDPEPEDAVSMDLPRDDGDEPCLYRGTTGCAETAMMFHANELK